MYKIFNFLALLFVSSASIADTSIIETSNELISDSVVWTQKIEGVIQTMEKRDALSCNPITLACNHTFLALSIQIQTSIKSLMAEWIKLKGDTVSILRFLHENDVVKPTSEDYLTMESFRFFIDEIEHSSFTKKEKAFLDRFIASQILHLNSQENQYKTLISLQEMSESNQKKVNDLKATFKTLIQSEQQSIGALDVRSI